MQTKKIYWGAVASTLVIGVGVYGVGHLSDGEAVALLRAMLPSSRFLCASVITATSTILALILTLISFSSSSEKNLKPMHYDRVKLIAKLACAAFIAAIFLLLFLTLPLEKSPDAIRLWMWLVYYIVLGYSAILGGLLIAIIIMLYQAAVDLILVVHPETDAAFLMSEEASDEEKEEEREKADK